MQGAMPRPATSRLQSRSHVYLCCSPLHGFSRKRETARSLPLDKSKTELTFPGQRCPKVAMQYICYLYTSFLSESRPLVQKRHRRETISGGTTKNSWTIISGHIGVPNTIKRPPCWRPSTILCELKRVLKNTLSFTCSNKLAWVLATRVKTLCGYTLALPLVLRKVPYLKNFEQKKGSLLYG